MFKLQRNTDAVLAKQFKIVTFIQVEWYILTLKVENIKLNSVIVKKYRHVKGKYGKG